MGFSVVSRAFSVITASQPGITLRSGSVHTFLGRLCIALGTDFVWGTTESNVRTAAIHLL